MNAGTDFACTNYKKIISSLILLKEDLFALDDKKYHELIMLLQGYNICIDDEDWKIPDKKEIAEKLKIPYAKNLLLIKGLYGKLLSYYSDNILEIKEVEQEVHIYIPPDEGNEKKRYYTLEDFSRNSRYIRVKMPIIPRIGEEITLDFIDRSYGLYRGYVHEVHHVIMGKRQIIEIVVHPYHGYYYKWKKMKDDYEDDQRWLKRIQAENRK